MNVQVRLKYTSKTSWPSEAEIGSAAVNKMGECVMLTNVEHRQCVHYPPPVHRLHFSLCYALRGARLDGFCKRTSAYVNGEELRIGSLAEEGMTGTLRNVRPGIGFMTSLTHAGSRRNPSTYNQALIALCRHSLL